jgi:hypothetical protein
LKVEDGSESSESDGEEVNLMMRAMMKHKSEEKKVQKRIKQEQDEA